MKNIDKLDFFKLKDGQKNESIFFELTFSNNSLTSLPYFNLPFGNYRVDFRNNLHRLETFQLLFLKIDNKVDLLTYSYFHKRFEHFKNLEYEEYFSKIDPTDINNIFLCRSKNLKSLFLLFLNSRIYTSENKKDFDNVEKYLKKLENYDMTVLDFLIHLRNDSFSNDDLINLNEDFDDELKQNPNLINLEFKLRSPDSIEALCERNDYSIFKKIFDLDKLEEKIEYSAGTQFINLVI